nr:TonB-dependent receptor [Sphingomonas sp. CDS-1]
MSILLAGASGMACAGAAFAQQSDVEVGNGEIGEIIVTANKRSENLSKVGASIAAFSGETLNNRNIARPEELAKTVPGLALAPSTHGTPVYTLRGVGYNADALGVYPAVSVSIDQAPMPFPVLAGHSMFDLERVEVLKGPQGTLFGQNSTGGAINYIAAKPTRSLEAGFKASYGRFNELRGTAYISGPLSDTLAVRVAVDGAHRGNWQYNFARSPQDNSSRVDLRNGEENYVAGRMILDWQPSDRLKIEINVNGSVDRSDPQALQLVSILANPTAPSIGELNAILAPLNVSRAANWSTDEARPNGNRKLFQTFLRADLDLSDNITLTSISTYNRLSQKMAFDLDGTDFQIVDAPQDNGTIKDFSQELRLSNANDVGSQFRWTVGGLYNKSRVKEDQWITYKHAASNNAANFFINASGIDTRSTIENWAVFANGEYDLTQDLTFKAGGRYTKSVNDTYICGYSPGDGNVATLFTVLGELFGGQTVPLSTTDCYPLNAQLLPGTPYLDTLSEDNISWRAGIDYRLTSDTLLYANVARGYKAGSYPAITAATQAELKPAKQESVTSYEAGFKTRFANNMVQLNGAVFYADYRDKQVQGSVTSSLFGLLQQLQNIPKSHIIGAEADLIFRPISGLTLTGSGSYLKTKVDRYESINTYGQLTDFSGDRLPFAPSWTLIGDVDYRIPLSDGGTIFLGGTVNYRSSADAYVGASRIEFPVGSNNSRTLLTRPYRIDGYTIVDARIGYEFPGDRVSVSAWGKNLFDTFNIQNAISYGPVAVRATGMPRTYGISLNVRWK